MKISTLILSGFFLILFLFSLTTYINYKQSYRVNENSEKFSRSSATLRNSNRFQRNILSMVSGLRGYLLTNESSFIQSYDSAVVENNAILKELSTLLTDNEAQGKRLAEIREPYINWVNSYADPLVEAKKVAAVSDSGAQSFKTLYRKKLSDHAERDLQQTLQRKFREFTNHEYTERETQKEQLTASVEQIRSVSFFLTALSIIVGIIIATFLANHISAGMIRLIQMADAIAGGDFNSQVPDQGNDEVSVLTRSLNRMARMLAENISLLRRKNEELNQFAHIVSHDLKGPLRGIDNVVSWIEEDHNLHLPSKVKEYVTVIKGRVARAENLLNGILSYSRVGREVQPKEIVNVKELLEEIRGYLPDNAGASLRIAANMPTLTTERLPLFQVFSNLISNAYKHHDGDNAAVRVYYEERETSYKFFVEDNGPGIAKAYHDKIFVIFQTLQERDSFESTGVGLAIVKKILTDRDLDVDVISEPGKGSIFAFTWPK